MQLYESMTKRKNRQYTLLKESLVVSDAAFGDGSKACILTDPVGSFCSCCDICDVI